jgi:hypothetical protein
VPEESYHLGYPQENIQLLPQQPLEESQHEHEQDFLQPHVYLMPSVSSSSRDVMPHVGGGYVDNGDELTGRPVLRVIRPGFEDEDEPDERMLLDPLENLDPSEKAPIGQSIFDSYDVENEVRFIGKHTELPQPRLERYIKENILKFTSEFAAKVPAQRLPGTISRDGRFDIAGFDMTEMTAETAEMIEAGSREKAEYVGMTRATRLLQQGIRQAKKPETVRVAWSSPSKKDTNYSILFYFEVGAYDEAMQGYPVIEKILRYDEKYGDLRKSRRVYTELQSLANQPWSGHRLKTDVDFLHEPILLYGDERTDRHVMENICGIDMGDVDFTQEFEARVMSKLGPLIHGYTSLALSMADGRIPMTSVHLKKLEDSLGRIYYWSKEIAKLMKSEQLEPTNLAASMHIDVYDDKADEQYRAARDRGELVTEDGTSCPTVKNQSIYRMAEKQTKLCE